MAKKVHKHFMMGEDTCNRLAAYCKKYGFSESEILRMLIHDFLEAREKEDQLRYCRPSRDVGGGSYLGNLKVGDHGYRDCYVGDKV